MPIISQDIGGFHNSNIRETQSRLIKDGSWKKLRVVVIIPTADSIPAKVSLAIWNLMFPPNNGVARLLALGMEVGEAYSKTIENVINNPELSKWEYILTIEHDNAPPSDGVLKLIGDLESNKNLAAVSGLYFTKGMGGVPQIWGDPDDPVLNFRPRVPKMEGLIECNGLGMGFTLYRMSLFKDPALRRPWFVSGPDKDGNGMYTQDLYAWTDFRKFGYKCAVDCSVKVGHYDIETDTMW
jgi:hypothetical protein